MMTFSKNLGDLAGHDIVLWREAGLDPRQGLGADGEVWGQGVVQRAAAWIGRMCRGSDLTAGSTRHANRPDLRPGTAHDHARFSQDTGA